MDPFGLDSPISVDPSLENDWRLRNPANTTENLFDGTHEGHILFYRCTVSWDCWDGSTDSEEYIFDIPEGVTGIQRSLLISSFETRCQFLANLKLADPTACPDQGGDDCDKPRPKQPVEKPRRIPDVPWWVTTRAVAGETIKCGLKKAGNIFGPLCRPLPDFMYDPDYRGPSG